MSNSPTATALAVQLALQKARLAVAKASFGSINRWPAGSSKGGQFAPKGTTGGAAGEKHPPNTFVETGWAGSGMWAKPKAPPPGAKPHPKADDKGKAVHIHYPTPASPAATWSNPKAVATFTPNGNTPEVLNGVPFKSWNPPKEGWAKVGGTNEKLDENFPFEPHPTKATGAGVVIVEPDGRVWLTKPTNEFGGYKHTLPKGTAESGLTLQQNAIKEAWEETGLKVKIIGIAADIERDTSKARYYFARRVGGTPKDMGWESQALRLAPRKQALDLLNKPHDKAMLADVMSEMGIHKAKDAPKESGKAGHWQFQERWKAGSALGGQWKAMGADGITAPPKIAGGLDGANSIYQKVANAAHDAAQKGDTTALNAAVAKYQGAADKFAAGGKVTSHVKWGAQVHQYATQVVADTQSKTKATATADKLAGPQKLSAMTHVGAKPGGSNPGGVYTDAEGKWVVKGSNGGDATPRSQNEVLASKLMAAVGVGAPDMKLVDLEGKHGGGIGVASKWVDGAQAFNPSSAAHLAAAQADFAVHAWLANYDALGMSMDNTVIKDGKAINIDPGGALLYRAQGAPKGDAFGHKADEWTSMRDVTKNPNGSKVYGQMSASQLIASAAKLNAIDNATIGKLVNTYGPGTADEKDALYTKLVNRKADILARAAALQAPVAPTPKPAPVSAPAPAVAPAAAQTHTVSQYTNTTEGHNKFWQSVVVGNTLHTQYGKIGSEGQISTKVFPTTAAALNAQVKLFSEKKAKGYVFAGNAEMKVPAPAAAAAPAQPAAAPAAAPAKPAPAKPAKPTFTGVNAQKFAAVADGLMRGDSMTVLGAVGTAPGGKKSITAGGVKVVLNNPPKSADGKKLNQLVKDLIVYHEGLKATAAAAPAAPAAPNGIVKPTNWPYQGNAKLYNAFATKAANLHAAGDLAGLKEMGNKTWIATSANGQVMTAYHQKLVDDLEAKQADNVKASLDAAPHVAPAKPVGNLPAMPHPDSAKFTLDATGSKATLKDKQSHNAKIDGIAQLAGKGDAKAILAMGYGVNTYGKKQAAFANDTLAAMGVPYKVFAGQKAGTHQALNAAGVATAQAATAAAQAAVPPSKKGSAAPKQSVPVFRIPSPPDFANWNGPGQGLSSKAAFNKQNDEIAKLIYETAKKGDATALKNLKFQPINTDGTPAGAPVLISSHPSKNITAYLKDAIDGATTPYQPLESVSAASFARVGEKFTALGKTFNDVAKLTEAKTKMGRYAILGKVQGDPLKNWQPTELSQKNGKVSTSDLYKQSIARFNALSATEKQAIKDYTGSGYSLMNDATTGEGTHSKTGYAIKGFDKASVPLKAGTVLSRKFSFKENTTKNMALLLASEGKVLKDFGMISTSTRPEVWSGNIHVRMVAGEGVKGLYVASNPSGGGGAISKHPGEDEVVLPYGTKFFVRKVHPPGHVIHDAHGTWGGSGKTVVEVVILPNI